MTLEDEYAYATECQLATLEWMQSLKSTSKSALARQQGICDRMVKVCRSIPDENLSCLQLSHREDQHCSRLVALLIKA